jgi:hypothetical protein
MPGRYLPRFANFVQHRFSSRRNLPARWFRRFLEIRRSLL